MAEVCSSPLKPFGKRLSTDYCEDPSLPSHMIQKRRRFQDLNLSPENVLVDEREVGFRQKRCRQEGDDENFDVPRYTARQMGELEQTKNQEIESLKAQMQQYMTEKEQELAQKQEETSQLHNQIEQGKAELERLNQENSVLKHGIRIQQGQVINAQAECEAKYFQERESLVKMGVEAAEHIRRLEAANYSLRVQLEQMAPSSSEMPSTPRWGY
jgi:chromosome segregation ATPase